VKKHSPLLQFLSFSDLKLTAIFHTEHAQSLSVGGQILQLNVNRPLSPRDAAAHCGPEITRWQVGSELEEFFLSFYVFSLIKATDMMSRLHSAYKCSSCTFNLHTQTHTHTHTPYAVYPRHIANVSSVCINSHHRSVLYHVCMFSKLLSPTIF